MRQWKTHPYLCSKSTWYGNVSAEENRQLNKVCLSEIPLCDLPPLEGNLQGHAAQERPQYFTGELPPTQLTAFLIFLFLLLIDVLGQWQADFRIVYIPKLPPSRIYYDMLYKASDFIDVFLTHWCLLNVWIFLSCLCLGELTETKCNQPRGDGSKWLNPVLDNHEGFV